MRTFDSCMSTCVCNVPAGFCNQGLNQNSTGACKCTAYGVPYCSVSRAGKSEIEGLWVRQQGERQRRKENEMETGTVTGTKHVGTKMLLHVQAV